MDTETTESALGPEVITALEQLGAFGDLDSFLDGNAQLVAASTVEALGEVVRQRLRTNVNGAIRLAECAVVIAERLQDDSSLGRGTRAKANALWFKGDCKAAVDLFDKAAHYFQLAGQTAEVGRTLSSSIQALALLGEYERASTAAAGARQIFTALGDDWRRARVELNFANVYHRQDRFAEALSLYESAYEELLRYKDSEGLGVALHNIAVCLIMLNDFERAVRCYDRVRALCASSNMPLLAVQADYNIAYLYFLRGDYDAAIEGLNRTRVRSREYGDSYHAALCDLDQAEIFLELNLSSEAVRMAGDAKRQFETLGMRFEVGRAAANLAIAFHRCLDNDRAVELFEEARCIFEGENNLAWQSLIDLYHATVLCESGRYDDARRLCLRSKAYFEEVGLERRKAVCELLLARLSLEAGDAATCQRVCGVVLQELPSLQAPLLAFRTQLLLGHAQWRCGDTKNAFEAFERARSELETLRTNLQGEELRIAFLNDKSNVYQSLVELCLDEGLALPETSFRLFEQAKSRSLAEITSRRPTEVEADQADVDAGRLRDLKGELNWLYRRIDREQTSEATISVEHIHRLRDAARAKEDEYVRFVRQRNGGQRLPGLLDGMVQELHEIRPAIGQNASLVEYFQTRTHFLAAVVDDKGLEIVRLAPAAEIVPHIQMLEFHFSKFRLHQEYAETFQSELIAATQNRLQILHDQLIAPLVSRLRRKHLIIVPHGVLHCLPFHALFDGTRYLIDRFTISYAPSASIYAMCHRRPANSEGGSLLMGIDDRYAPFIEQELELVAQALPDSRIYFGETATSAVLRTLGAASRHIHIASHGAFRRDNPMFSSVRLADAHVTLHDLYQMNLPVDLLTLSGCGTGMSVVAEGDELLGLVRGLLGAGARTLLLSLWDVHDRTTAEFMARFYNHARIGLDNPRALQAAMLETRERLAHPYYWAPFMLVGKAITE